MKYKIYLLVVALLLLAAIGISPLFTNVTVAQPIGSGTCSSSASPSKILPSREIDNSPVAQSPNAQGQTDCTQIQQALQARIQTLEARIVELQSTIGILQIVLVLAGILIFVLILVSLGFAIAWSNTRKQLLANEKENARLESELARAVKTLNVLIGRDSPVDMLNDCERILYWREKRGDKETVEDSLGFLEKLLSTIKTSLGIEPIEGYWNMVKFDAALHTSPENLMPGERVRVIETGWRRDRQIIKPALVRKDRGL